MGCPHAHRRVHAHRRGHTHGRAPAAHGRPHTHRCVHAHGRRHAHRGRHAHRSVHAPHGRMVAHRRSEAHGSSEAHGRAHAHGRPKAHGRPQTHRCMEAAAHGRGRTHWRRSTTASAGAHHARQERIRRRCEVRGLALFHLQVLLRLGNAFPLLVADRGKLTLQVGELLLNGGLLRAELLDLLTHLLLALLPATVVHLHVDAVIDHIGLLVLLVVLRVREEGPRVAAELVVIGISEVCLVVVSVNLVSTDTTNETCSPTTTSRHVPWRRVPEHGICASLLRHARAHAHVRSRLHRHFRTTANAALVALGLEALIELQLLCWRLPREQRHLAPRMASWQEYGWGRSGAGSPGGAEPA
mmetsp:Transcript_19950/g.42588  ORF Transcript_19950/g.42588 Transcript_19950/m.42588 type:complete len:356 (+) Transcript_19950:2618-3685(+)